jgi:(1->4)-alpha-D-glucan 1-alpha-D-glucosylmutase
MKAAFTSGRSTSHARLPKNSSVRTRSSAHPRYRVTPGQLGESAGAVVALGAHMHHERPLDVYERPASDSSEVRPLTSTYRLQLNSSFTLHDARARIPYLRALGISHLYCSPILAARTGSTHGYDVADPTHVSSELGGDDAFIALAHEAHAHDMGILLDIVPNHMGTGAENPYWDDVLAHGKSSRYASWFDVEWRAPTRRLAGKVLLPVLGDTLDAVIARDEITVDVTDQAVRLRYFGHSFPIDPAALPPELELAQRDPSAREIVDRWSRGDDGRQRLRTLLSRQHYELAFWRTAQRDLNYRRFFDVNELISLRVENADVFEATHAKVLEFVAAGLVDGLRVDHIDGLLEPRRYLERLRAAVDARRPARAGDARFPILVEKILAPGETLPASWPVDGTTGYEFMVTLEDLFIDPAGYAKLESAYRRSATAPDFHAVVVESKRRVLRNALNADVRRVAPMLAAVARRAGWPTRSIAAYAGAIVELIAMLPVYRTYIDVEQPEPSVADRAVLERAFTGVRGRGNADSAATDALERTLLGAWQETDPQLARTRLRFVLRWQQLTGPAAAKGVEDTALYVYAPLASRNEVGGDPGVPVEDADTRLHALLAERALRHPRSLNATNTHDTKRSADVRSRIDTLSECSASWARRLAHWRRHHRALRTMVGGRLAPTRTTDNFIYQTLLGLWPIGDGPSRDGERADDDRRLRSLRDRLTAYIQKAVREAKVSTSWTDPDAAYETAVSQYIGGLMDRTVSGAFLRELEQFIEGIARATVWNALSRVVIHLTAPGVPDVYQGDELWFQALVDPDNRAPVDWRMRDEALRQLDAAARGGASAAPAQLRAWLNAPGDGWLKMYLFARLLPLRRTSAAMAPDAGYAALRAEGARANQLFAFRRGSGNQAMVVVAARLTGGGATELPLGEAWADGTVRLDPGTSAVDTFRCALSGEMVRAVDGALPLAGVFAHLPVAVLFAAQPTP